MLRSLTFSSCNAATCSPKFIDGWSSAHQQIAGSAAPASWSFVDQILARCWLDSGRSVSATRVQCQDRYNNTTCLSAVHCLGVAVSDNADGGHLSPKWSSEGQESVEQSFLRRVAWQCTLVLSCVGTSARVEDFGTRQHTPRVPATHHIGVVDCDCCVMISTRRCKLSDATWVWTDQKHGCVRRSSNCQL